MVRAPYGVDLAGQRAGVGKQDSSAIIRPKWRESAVNLSRRPAAQVAPHRKADQVDHAKVGR